MLVKNVDYGGEYHAVMHLIDSPVQLGLHARLIALKGSERRAPVPAPA